VFKNSKLGSDSFLRTIAYFSGRLSSNFRLLVHVGVGIRDSGGSRARDDKRGKLVVDALPMCLKDIPNMSFQLTYFILHFQVRHLIYSPCAAARLLCFVERNHSKKRTAVNVFAFATGRCFSRLPFQCCAVKANFAVVICTRFAMHSR
jgi:hypothetical protein